MTWLKFEQSMHFFTSTWSVTVSVMVKNVYKQLQTDDHFHSVYFWYAVAGATREGVLFVADASRVHVELLRQAKLLQQAKFHFGMQESILVINNSFLFLNLSSICSEDTLQSVINRLCEPCNDLWLNLLGRGVNGSPQVIKIGKLSSTTVNIPFEDTPKVLYWVQIWWIWWSGHKSSVLKPLCGKSLFGCVHKYSDTFSCCCLFLNNAVTWTVFTSLESLKSQQLNLSHSLSEQLHIKGSAGHFVNAV